MNPKNYELLWKLEGLHTVETAAEKLGITRQATLNLLCRLKKEQHVTVSGGGKIKRIYKITIRKQLPRVPGMFDIINKYSPHMKLNPWYDHQVHGRYGPEEALIRHPNRKLSCDPCKLAPLQAHQELAEALPHGKRKKLLAESGCTL